MAENQTKYALQFTRKRLFVWGGLVFFVMGWMFVLGILVGRGTAPIPLKAHELEQELQALKASMLQKQQDEIETRVNQGDAPTTELGFYEALKKPPAKAQHQIADSPKPVSKPSRTSESAEKRSSTPAPVPTIKPPKPEPIPSSPVAANPAPTPKPAASETTPPAAKGRFTIQVGSFKEAESADSMVSKLRSKGYPAYHLRTELPGKGVWYRVRVGAFEARSAAETMLAKLNGEKVSGMVVGTP